MAVVPVGRFKFLYPFDKHFLEPGKLSVLGQGHPDHYGIFRNIHRPFCLLQERTVRSS